THGVHDADGAREMLRAVADMMVEIDQALFATPLLRERSINRKFSSRKIDTGDKKDSEQASYRVHAGILRRSPNHAIEYGDDLRGYLIKR
ncbi:MAG: hypothetical protein L0219_22225, partial [Phycisphaerales bacterium]|nr:hypothetical protein [Phycisphaerales bacterium]